MAPNSNGSDLSARFKHAAQVSDPSLAQELDGRNPGTHETVSAVPNTPSEHRTGPEMADLTITEVLQSMTVEDLKQLPRQPCVRDSLLAGILGGFVAGGGRAVLGGTVEADPN